MNSYPSTMLERFFSRELHAIATRTMSSATLPIVPISRVSSHYSLFLFTRPTASDRQRIQTIREQSRYFEVARFRLVRSIHPNSFIYHDYRNSSQCFQGVLFRGKRLNVFKTRVVSPVQSAVHFVSNSRQGISTKRRPIRFTGSPFKKSMGRFRLSLCTRLSCPITFFLQRRTIRHDDQCTVNSRPFSLIFRRDSGKECCSNNSQRVSHQGLRASQLTTAHERRSRQVFFLRNTLCSFNLWKTR